MTTSRMKVCGPTKQCRSCQRELARRHFFQTGSVNPHDGQRYGDHTCRVCGCTDLDCRACIERTGAPCFWYEPGLCSACAIDQLVADLAAHVELPPVPAKDLLTWEDDGGPAPATEVES